MTALSVADLIAATGDRLDAADLPTNLDLSGAQLVASESGVLLIADFGIPTLESTTAALKMLVQVAGESGRSIAVLGELHGEAIEANDDHDAVGRLVVRLNVSQLVVVGHGARHIHNAAGLEGSWDGESQLVDTAGEAYDLLREQLREGDVVLIKASRSEGFESLVHQLGGAPE